MPPLLRKLLAILPVTLLGIVYLHDHQSAYRHASGHRLALLGMSLALVYGLIILDALRDRRQGLPMLGVQASFYIYLFMVLTLTGYFILFREVSAHGWWQRMVSRVDHRDHVNLRLFQMFRIYHLASKQVLGNFVMLLPLGIYLPLRYRRMNGFWQVLAAGLLVSVGIETLQLVTSFRSADVDDVLLNTTGAAAGYLLYRTAILVARLSQPPVSRLA